MKLKRTHDCGSLKAQDAGKEVVLAGWVETRRDHGGLIFIDLRDRAGITQIVFSIDTNQAALSIADAVRSEYVVAVKGKVFMRPEGTANPDRPTGEIEVYISQIELLNTSKTPPFPLTDDTDASEALKLKYRYLDLRRRPLQKALMTRHRICATVRRFLDNEAFIDVETRCSPRAPRRARATISSRPV